MTPPVFKYMCTKQLHEEGGWFGKSAINIPRSNTQDYQMFHMARCISGLTTNIHKHTAHACFNKEKKNYHAIPDSDLKT